MVHRMKKQIVKFTTEKKYKRYGVGEQEPTGSWALAGWRMSSSLNCFTFLFSPHLDPSLCLPVAALTSSPCPPVTLFFPLLQKTKKKSILSLRSICFLLLLNLTGLVDPQNHFVGGKVLTWGRGTSGQLGLGEMVNSLYPMPVTSLQDYFITHVSAGWSHSGFVSGSFSCNFSVRGGCVMLILKPTFDCF